MIYYFILHTIFCFYQWTTQNIIEYLDGLQTGLYGHYLEEKTYAIFFFFVKIILLGFNFKIGGEFR